MKIKSLVLLCFSFNLLVLLSLSHPVQAATITTYTDRATFEATAGAITTETFDSYTSDVSFDNTSEDVGDFTLSSVNTSSSIGFNVIDATPFLFASVNGTSDIVMVTEVNKADVTLAFDTTISAFGFDSFGFLDDGRTAEMVFDGIDSIFLPTVTGNINQFHGFISDGLFTTVIFRSSTTGMNDVFLIDDVTYATSAVVPEPSTWLLCLSGLIALGVVRWKRRRGRFSTLKIPLN